MSPREFLAVAIMLSTNFDERMLRLAEMEAVEAPTPIKRATWWAYSDEHALRIGAKRALWLEAQP